MKTIESIKSQIQRLYETNPNVHVNIKMTHPRISVKDTAAVITGVYRNLFRIVEHDCGYARTHSIQYAEVLIGQVVIAELELDAPENPPTL
ncbi:MAG: hypothetical protein IKJ35_05305 [Clostridia bacterium]|nr:hypothetical protein [Clostridia bacterium]